MNLRRCSLPVTGLIMLLILIVNQGVLAQSFEPAGLYLTWQQDPATTMTIDWHVTDADRGPQLQYRRVGANSWINASGDTRNFPFSVRRIHRAELTGLMPDTVYEFRFGPDSRVYRFRTMPAELSRPVLIAAGGDTMHRMGWFEEVNRQAMKFDLDFVMIGGDLAYADGLAPSKQQHRDPTIPRPHNQWYSWFDAVKNTLITEDGRVIPILVAIGNHEVNGSYWFADDRRPQLPAYEQTDRVRSVIAPYFFQLFAMPGQPGYNAVDFGDYLSILLLDTDHTNPVEGVQTQWLEEQLAVRTHVKNVFPIYHIPAWPSVRDMNDRVQTAVRDHWVPLFEQYNLQLAFENHDHAYKRTHPIRNGQVDPSGVVYIGDGAWGTATREIGSRQEHEAWYIAEAAAERHFILVEVLPEGNRLTMINIEGEVIDSLDLTK